MRKLFLVAFFGIGLSVVSCGGTIKDISFQTGDYLGTGYDEPSEKKQTKEKSAEKKSFLKALAVATSDSTEEEEMPDIYEKSVKMTFEEVDLILRTELENSNFKIIHVAHVAKGAQEQGVKDFWQNMNLYMVCKLSACTKVLKNNPQLLSQFPIRVYTYEKDGKTVVGMFRPSTAIKYMGNPDIDAIKALKQLDREIKNIIDNVTK